MKSWWNMIRIRGIVIPVEWDEKGNVISVAISSQDEDEYLIENQEKGQELRAFSREEVEVFGVLTEEGDRKRIKVKRYNLKKRK
jgi:hypothetical protein